MLSGPAVGAAVGRELTPLGRLEPPPPPPPHPARRAIASSAITIFVSGGRSKVFFINCTVLCLTFQGLAIVGRRKRTKYLVYGARGIPQGVGGRSHRHVGGSTAASTPPSRYATSKPGPSGFPPPVRARTGTCAGRPDLAVYHIVRGTLGVQKSGIYHLAPRSVTVATHEHRQEISPGNSPSWLHHDRNAYCARDRPWGRARRQQRGLWALQLSRNAGHVRRDADLDGRVRRAAPERRRFRDGDLRTAGVRSRRCIVQRDPLLRAGCGRERSLLGVFI